MNQNLYTEGKPVNSVNDAGGAAGDTNKYGAKACLGKLFTIGARKAGPLMR